MLLGRMALRCANILARDDRAAAGDGLHRQGAGAG
eukprot:CAMPEP_0119416688 /NCGR_PEP_ID=MMETSP1335-20130426/13772_1 /TAXON_ID=259385 /ORGANISM="Chrysoculter rhomboideus, Strain RCC1486" /LENGTH=34 /DNA_ID= /DNA_START= /DNA_END= /DNA_ORIENTATION=